MSDGNSIGNLITGLVEEMENLTLDAAVGTKRYKALAERLDKKRPATLKRTLEFLQDVREKEYKEVNRIWTLPTMTDEVWFNYLNLFPDTDFEETALLKKARKALKMRYVAFFKTTSKTKTNKLGKK